MDEVGRGALAGPVSVGVVVIDAATPTAPAGVRDSKLLTPTARQTLVPRIQAWALAFAVGHAQPAEIDLLGIVPALRLAGRRALAALAVSPGCVLLDGSHDWLSDPVRSGRVAAPQVEGVPGQECLFDPAGEVDPADGDDLLDLPREAMVPVPALSAGGIGPGGQESLFEFGETTATSGPSAERSGSGWPGRFPSGSALPLVRGVDPWGRAGCPAVITRVKADLTCAAVAAASVLAKVERDSLMCCRHGEYPAYSWAANKGYASPDHVAALRLLGPSPQHRRSWSLPGVGERAPQPEVLPFEAVPPAPTDTCRSLDGDLLTGTDGA